MVDAPRRSQAASRLSAPVRVGLYTCLIAALAALLTFQLPGLHGLAVLGSAAPWVILACFALVEGFVIHFEFRNDAHSVSVSEIPLAVGLFLLPPVVLVAVRVLGSGIGLGLIRRQSARKLAFNVSQLAVESALVAHLFQILQSVAGTSPQAPAGEHLLSSWGAATLAVLCGAFFTTSAVLGVIHLSGAPVGPGMVRALLMKAAANAVGGSSAAVVGVVVLQANRLAWLLLLAVAVLVCLAYRVFVHLRERALRVESLYAFTSALDGGSGQVALRSVLEQAGRLLHADTASLTLVHQDADEAQDGPTGATRHTLHADGRLETSLAPILAPEWPWARVFSSQEPLLIKAKDRDPGLRAYAQLRGVRDAVLVPLRNGSEVVGTMFVGNRAGEFTTFTQEDVKLLQGIADHAGVALRNGQLVDRLLHDSRHDALTGLPNRAHFQAELRAALVAVSHPDSGPLAVLLMDLDRFKEVNDTLGHHAGDDLLREVASRLRDSLPAGCLVARLGGDEFALLLPDRDVDSAREVAGLLRRALSRPFLVGEVTVDVGAAVGVAVAPEHGLEAGVLLRHADIAMYDAKDGAGVASYDTHRDSSSPGRLALVSELRQAITAGELRLHYQPQGSTADGAVQAVEALVRWQHPRRGLIGPDEFVPAAERTGLIHPLTGWVLREALLQCRQMARCGHDVSVAVNISVRCLLDPDLPDLVAAEVSAAGLAPDRLTLEVTETTLMQDRDRCLATLRRLAAIGVRLSVDDFGTGYSSLAQLRDMPVHEVKIDRSFVTRVAADRQDAAIVSAVVALAASLDLQVVAEGVEDDAARRRLVELGCPSFQGYHLCRPIPGADLLRWFDDRAGSAALAPVRQLRPRDRQQAVTA